MADSYVVAFQELGCLAGWQPAKDQLDSLGDLFGCGLLPFKTKVASEPLAAVFALVLLDRSLLEPADDVLDEVRGKLEALGSHPSRASSSARLVLS